MISKIFSLRNYIMKQIMKTNKQGIIQIPDKGKVDFGEMIIRENLFKKGIDPSSACRPPASMRSKTPNSCDPRLETDGYSGSVCSINLSKSSCS